ncbi:MAG: hypothetical protein B6242_12370 [Anaerolineaceae bacterium 4572_78]|nr:MAG: hypothetical protein B6242_12370 [Anaerolineaceae bacterium 4572_78]
MTVKTRKVFENLSEVKEKKEKTFSDYKIADVLILLDLPPPLRWKLEFKSIDPSPFLTYGLQQALIQITSDSNEQEQRFFMELFFMEALVNHKLRMWQERPLDAGKSPFRGIIDFALTPYQPKFKTPYLVLSEAKKDDFEQGWGQCLLAMKTCQMLNEQEGLKFDIHGIVSTGKFWEFGKLTVDNQFYTTAGYALAQPDMLLGAVDYMFTLCENNIPNTT